MKLGTVFSIATGNPAELLACYPEVLAALAQAELLRRLAHRDKLTIEALCASFQP